MVKQINGWHVLGMFTVGFGIIIAVNIALAWSAVTTFPGLEVKNSYVASQSFDADRAAQEALGWDVAAGAEPGTIWLSVDKAGSPVQPQIVKAVLGRATHVGEDQVPAFTHDGTRFVAPADLGPGNWNLRLEMRAADGTLFRQRVVLRVAH